MGAIDLLFGVNPTCERVHQLALASLLPNTNLLRQIGIPESPEDFRWEPSKGQFDLAVNLKDGRKVWVEIKVDDAKLKKDEQLGVVFEGHEVDDAKLKKDEQLGVVFEGQEHVSDHLIYALLGVSQHYVDGAAFQGELDKRKAGHSGTARVLTSSDLIGMLGDPNVVTKGGTDQAELAAAYGRLLTTLDDRFDHFAGNPVENWKWNDYVGAFATCRKKIPSMKGARIGYATWPGNFHYCAWRRRRVDGDAILYLSFENGALRFKASIPESVGGADRRSQIWGSIHEKLVGAAQSATLTLTRPGRVRSASTMTVATVTPSPLQQEKDWQELPLLSSVVAEAEAILERVPGSP